MPATTVPKPWPRMPGRPAGGRRRRAAAARSTPPAARASRRNASKPSPVMFEIGQNRGAFQKRAPQEVASRSPDQLAGARSSTRSILVRATKPVANAQQREDVEMLAGLRHDAVVGGDDQDHAVHAGGAGDHRLDEVLVAGHVDDADFQVGDRAGGEAEVDRHAPLFLLLEPIGLAAGQAFDQGGLAVVDMPGGSQGDVDLLCIAGHRAFRARFLRMQMPCQYHGAASTASDDRSDQATMLHRLKQRSRVDQHLVVLDACDDRRASLPQSSWPVLPPNRHRGAMATSRVGRFWVGRSRCPSARSRRQPTTSAATARSLQGRGNPFGLGGDFVERAAQHPQRGHFAACASSSRNSVRVASRAARVSLSGRTMRAKGFLRTASTSVLRPRMMPALRGADQFVGAQVTRSAPARTDSARVGSLLESEPRKIDQRAGPHIVDHRRGCGHGRSGPSFPAALRP